MACSNRVRGHPSGRARFQLVPDLVAGLPGGHDLPRPPVGRPDLASICRLASAARVEDGAVEKDEGAPTLGLRRLDRTNRRRDAPRVGIDVADVVAHGMEATAE